MNTLPLILTCLASGAVGAGAMKFISPAPQTASADETVAELQESLEAMAAEVRRMNNQYGSLADTVDRMDSETQYVPFVAERTAVPEEITSGDSIAAVDASSEAIQIGENRISQAQFQNWVKQANENLQAQERAQREAERAVREGERTEERVAALTTELGLDARQQSEFRRHFEEQAVKRRDMMQAMRDGTVDRGDMREAWNTMREEANADVQTFLSGQQYETYQESENNDSNRFGRRGGGGGNRGGGNGAGNGGGNNGGAAGGGRRGGF